jgi:hypothetical protein
LWYVSKISELQSWKSFAHLSYHARDHFVHSGTFDVFLVTCWFSLVIYPSVCVFLQAFHLQLNVMTQETHSAVTELIEKCRQS